MSWCEPFPASRGDSSYGACTSLTGGPRSFRSPVLSRGSCAHAPACNGPEPLPRTGSPDCHGREDALMSISNPCSYRHRVPGRSAVDSDEDDDVPAAPTPKTRYTSKGLSEGLTEDSPELPPRRRQNVAAAPAQAVTSAKAKNKKVHWSPHLVVTHVIQCAGSSEGEEGSGRSTSSDDDADDRPPRLPSSRSHDLPKPRLPKGVAGLLGDAQSSTLSPRRARVPYPNYMEQLGEVGLLTSVWPPQRVVMGLCVSRRLQAELVSCSSVVIPMRVGGDVPAAHVLEKLVGTLFICANTATAPVKPSEKTRSIKSFMKSLLQDDEPAPRGTPSAQEIARKGEGQLPISKLRVVRHRIHKLDLAGCRIGVDGGVALSSLLFTPQYRNSRCSRTGDMASLQHLNLARNQITSPLALFAAIASLPNLAHLDLSHNTLGPAGCKALSGALAKYPSNQLKTLDISDNAIGDNGLRAICSILPQLMLLDKLVATSNNIGDEGAGALAAVLTCCATLADVDLTSNMVSEEGQWALAAARVSCRLASSTSTRSGRLVNIDTRRFLHFHPLGGPSGGTNWCFLCYTSEQCTCPVLS